MGSCIVVRCDMDRASEFLSAPPLSPHVYLVAVRLANLHGERLSVKSGYLTARYISGYAFGCGLERDVQESLDFLHGEGFLTSDGKYTTVAKIPSVWKDGENRGGHKHLVWRSKVIARDGMSCTHCGASDRRLVVHHLKSWTKYTELRYDVDNGVTLCYDCHKSLHSGMWSI